MHGKRAAVRGRRTPGQCGRIEYTPQQGARVGHPTAEPLPEGKGRPAMLGCFVVFGLILGGLVGGGLGLGVLLHWVVPAIDVGIGTLSGMVAMGVALVSFGYIMSLAEPLEAVEEASPAVCG